MQHYGMLIDGELTNASDGRVIRSINPATADSCASFPAATSADIDRAVSAARNASASWACAEQRERSDLLLKVAAAIRREHEGLARLETLDSGKPIHDTANFDLPDAANVFEFFAHEAAEIRGETIPAGCGMLDYTVRSPVGVVAQIAPWNFPLVNAAWKIAPAVAIGNTIVFKPSELASVTSLRLGELCMEAGCPRGVVNVVSGYGREAGAALASHPGIDKVSFTGSTATGRRVLESAARAIKPATLELGGKSANIVFADADLDQAVDGVLFGIFFNAGQVCTAGSRLLVAEPVKAGFVERLIAAASRIRVGDPLDSATRMGPLISEEQQRRVREYIDGGKAAGSQIVFESAAPEGPGYYVPATIFDHVDPGSPLAREEIFGPVLCVFSFEREEEAVALANDSAYGLAAGIWTRDLSRAHRVAAQLDTGTVWVNTYNFVTPRTPAPARKASGFGVEMGTEGLLEYTKLKNVLIDLEAAPMGYFR